MHLTVRMAWHDNNWCGKVCNDPQANTYCSGAHSLLSDRILKKKNVALESQEGIKGEYVSKNFKPDSVPPCYWSINAFGDQEIKVIHSHAYSTISAKIKDTIKPHSVITWPFKLSFVHNPMNIKKHGNYWPDLDKRIQRWINKFELQKSIIFFYANYDNPVSADDMKYLVLGCSVIKERPEPIHFNFDPKELENVKKGDKRNFPSINWMLQFTHDPDSCVLIPYKEYIDYLECYPAQEKLLQDIRVIVEEESLVRGFKYVAMDIDDDKCLYLLYKIRKSFFRARAHRQEVVQSDFDAEIAKLDGMICSCWAKRGIYPALNHILKFLFEYEEDALRIRAKILPLLNSEYDLGSLFDDFAKGEIHPLLQGYKQDILELSEHPVFQDNYKALAVLALVNLTYLQVTKILKSAGLLAQMIENPYCLYEEYFADEDDLDNEDLGDEPIDIYKIDIAMIPDRRFCTKHRGLQNYKEDSPQRVRAVIINYLKQQESAGHCYDTTQNILNDIKENPLFYKDKEARINETGILEISGLYKSHFIEKLEIKQVGDTRFVYLKHIKDFENLIKSKIDVLLARNPHQNLRFDKETHINYSIKRLQHILQSSENLRVFSEERNQLYSHVFDKSLYLLTGKPGSGKTHETCKIIETLKKNDQSVVILAPTGKAALRLNENIRNPTSKIGSSEKQVEAMTIDRFIYMHSFSRLYDSPASALSISNYEKIKVENLIIDECSMLDVTKFALLLSIIELSDKYPKRLILVGDENQLPPIGYGKPFYDIIQYICKDSFNYASHYINLSSNCRQGYDFNILKLADAFDDKAKQYEEALDIIDKGEGRLSQGLSLYKWKTADELQEHIHTALDEVFSCELSEKYDTKFEMLNALFGLYSNGYVNNQNYSFRDKLKLDKMQILSPYRSGYYGTLGLNRFFQENFRIREENAYHGNDTCFLHAEKIINLNNWYKGRGAGRELFLSNGSIGVYNSKKHYPYHSYYFTETNNEVIPNLSTEDFDLAYSITIHKSQGSDFDNVFLVIPQKISLLSKELLYTALTRSRGRLFLFIQDTDENLLLKARKRSHLINRNTSIFFQPEDKKRRYEPVSGVFVQSKIEYIIYEALMRSGLKFKYEESLKLPNLRYLIHPDFTIYRNDGSIVYWEHLGMLDTRKYYADWQNRKRAYFEHQFSGMLLTTDDLEGVKEEKINDLIDDIIEGNLKKTVGNKFSDHHYELY